MIVTIVMVNWLMVMISTVDIHYTITKQHIFGGVVGKLQQIGELILEKQAKYNDLVAYVQPVGKTLLGMSDFNEDTTVVLTFTHQPSNSIFRSAVSKPIEVQQFSQNVFINIDDNMQIKGISYMQTMGNSDGVNTHIVKMEKGRQEIFKIVPVDNTAKQQEQGIFAKYKWPIMIGIGIVALSSMLSPQPAANGEARPA